MNEPLPVGIQLGGVLWTWVVPVALFVITFAATWMLYRHFANQKRNGG